MHHINPTCGDEVTLKVSIAEDGADPVVRDVSYDAKGCSISIASSSVLADEVIGRPVSHALTTFEAMREMLTSKGKVAGDEEVIGDGVAFAGVAKYPARVKCALLGWTALTDALARSGQDISRATAAHADPRQQSPRQHSPRERNDDHPDHPANVADVEEAMP